MSDQSAGVLVASLRSLDRLAQQYLGSVVRPLTQCQEQFHIISTGALLSILIDNKAKVPGWLTANSITYFRTSLLVPCLLLLAFGQNVAPSMIVIVADVGDILDGVVARFWIDVRKEQEEEISASSSREKISRPSSPTQSDDDSFEVVSTGSPHSMASWSVLHRNRIYGEYLDPICDKAFVVFCWISLLSRVPGSGLLHWLQYLALISLVLLETASVTHLLCAFYASGGVAPPRVEGFEFTTSLVQANRVEKTKQRFAMLGTAIFIVPWLRYVGLLLLLLAIPLAYESFRHIAQKRVMYVNGSYVGNKFDYRTLKFWMQAKAMGSKLIVGIPQQNTDMILNACACGSVDEVIAEAPAKVDLVFLKNRGIDYVITMSPGESKFVTGEVLNADRCLTIGEDGVARPCRSKEEAKQD